MPLNCKWCDGKDVTPVCGHCLGVGVAKCIVCGQTAEHRDEGGNDFCSVGCWRYYNYTQDMPEPTYTRSERFDAMLREARRRRERE